MAENPMEPITKTGDKITLAGVEWFVPKLRASQIPYVVPEMMRFSRDCLDPEKVHISHHDDPENPGTKKMVVLLLDKGTYVDMLNATYSSLTWNYPRLTRELFDGLAIDPEELISSVDGIRRAAGLRREERKGGAQPDAAPAGEPSGAPELTTGKSSS